jgi:ubiquinone/menaquinone biosynthesis C-methylase UbiE
MSASGSYAAGMLGHDRPTELQRLQLRERVMDPQTRRILLGRGLEPEWRCLELGAGTGSVARWLARRCREGRVVATDVDTRHLLALRAANLEVLQHDVVQDDFPEGSFDLVHARSLLANVPERDAVLPKIARWLAPGGWAVLEEPLVVHDSSPYPAFRRLFDAYERALALSHGCDARWPRRLPLLLYEAGLRDIGMQPTVQLVGDGGAAEQVWRTAFDQARDQMIALELISEEEFAAGVALLDDPSFVDVAMVLISAWGRRAAAP